MRKLRLFTLILPIAAIMLSFSGCKMDNSLNFNSIDDSITIGDFFSKKIATETFVLEDLISADDIIAMNDDLREFIETSGIVISDDTAWDIIEEYQKQFGTPLAIPNMSFGPFDIDGSMGISDSDLDMLVGDGQIFIILDADSSLPVDIDIRIDFIYPDGIVSLLEEPITIHGADNGGSTDEDVKIEITSEQLRAISKATGIAGEVVNSNDSVTLKRDSYIEFDFTLEKTGGITL